jgi:hypothetical protein
MAETISEITAELVARGIPRHELPDTIEEAQVAPKPPPTFWYTHDDDNGRIAALHLCGRTADERDWQMEVVETIDGLETRVISEETEVAGALMFWPGLPTAERFALKTLELSVEACEEYGNRLWGDR